MWRSCIGGEQRSSLDVTGAQPFAQHSPVHGNVPKHPFMRDVIKTSANVSFEYPRRAGGFGQHEEALADGISRGSFRSKAVGVCIRRCLRNRRERQQEQGLHRAVVHGRDAQRTQLAVGFRYVDPPQGQGLVPMPAQRVDRSVFGCLCLDAGVFQIAPSTPGVRLPLLSVTRLTAKARPAWHSALRPRRHRDQEHLPLETSTTPP